MTVKIADLLPPERVQEIAETILEQRGDTPSYGWAQEYAMDCLNAAAPEIARAVLLWAAREFEGSDLGDKPAFSSNEFATALRQMAHGIEP